MTNAQARWEQLRKDGKGFRSDSKSLGQISGNQDRGNEVGQTERAQARSTDFGTDDKGHRQMARGRDRCEITVQMERTRGRSHESRL